MSIPVHARLLLSRSFLAQQSHTTLHVGRRRFPDQAVLTGRAELPTSHRVPFLPPTARRTLWSLCLFVVKVLMMEQAPQCTLMGERTYGSSGNPQPVPLANGVTVHLPTWVAMTPGGVPIEGKGVSPDVAIAFPGGPGNEDPIVDAALEWLAANGRRSTATNGDNE